MSAARFQLRRPGTDERYCAPGKSEPVRFAPQDEERRTQSFMDAERGGYTEKVTGVIQAAAAVLGGERCAVRREM